MNVRPTKLQYHTVGLGIGTDTLILTTARAMTTNNNNIITRDGCLIIIYYHYLIIWLYIYNEWIHKQTSLASSIAIMQSTAIGSLHGSPHWMEGTLRLVAHFVVIMKTREFSFYLLPWHHLFGCPQMTSQEGRCLTFHKYHALLVFTQALCPFLG